MSACAETRMHAKTRRNDTHAASIDHRLSEPCYGEASGVALRLALT